MENVLLTAGIASVIAAIAGGGLKAFGIEIPLLRSVCRQVILGLLGLVMILFAVGLHEGTGGQPNGGETGSGAASGGATGGAPRTPPPPEVPSPVTPPVQQGWLGLQLEDLVPETVSRLGLINSNGAYVAGVQPGSPAAVQGIMPGDIIVSCNGAVVVNARQMAELIRQSAGKELWIQVLRNGYLVPGRILVGAQ